MPKNLVSLLQQHSEGPACLPQTQKQVGDICSFREIWIRQHTMNYEWSMGLKWAIPMTILDRQGMGEQQTATGRWLSWSASGTSDTYRNLLPWSWTNCFSTIFAHYFATEKMKHWCFQTKIPEKECKQYCQELLYQSKEGHSHIKNTENPLQKSSPFSFRNLW